MSAQPTVSVVIPVRDPDERLPDVLRGVVAACAGAPGVVEILVVDDASVTGRERFDAAGELPRVRVLHLEAWAGRAGARDAGARAARGELLWFLDGDCVPRDDALAHHLVALAGGASASLGLVDAPAAGFWGRYQEIVLARRARAPADEQSIANCMLRRDAYLSLGGLDAGFRHYGFEDRDFILRAQAAGWYLRVMPDAVAVHRGEVTLESFCRKMNEAARLSAPRFAARHPAAYGRSPIGRIDARRHGAFYRRCAVALGALQSPVCSVASAVIDRAWIPFAAKVVVVRIAVALAYLRGSLGLPLAGGDA